MNSSELTAMPDSVEGKRLPAHLPTLDGWRAVAILTVMLHHGADSIKHGLGPWASGCADLFQRHGQIGVHVFFGISGFLICNRLLVEKSRFGRISLKAFYVRRVFRILPPLLVFLVAVGLLGWWGVIPVRPLQWIAAVFFLANYTTDGTWYLGHFWSLAVEEHFYLSWPGVLALAGTQRARWIAITIGLIVGVWRAMDLLYGIAPPSAPNLWGRTDTQVDGLLWGCAIAVMYSDHEWRTRAASVLKGWPFHALCLGLLVTILYRPRFKIWLIVLTLQAVAIPLVLLGTVLHPRRWLGVVLEWAPLQWIGRLSYSLYVWQQLFLVWDSARAPRMGFLQELPFNVAGSLVCATTSYYLVEKPFVALGRRISSALTVPAAATRGCKAPAEEVGRWPVQDPGAGMDGTAGP